VLKSYQVDALRQQQLDATMSDDGRGDISHVTGNTAAGKKACYQVPEHEQHLVHVELVQYVRKPGTRDFDRVARVQPLSVQEFERMEKNDSFAPYQGEDGEVNLLHDPRSKARQQADKTGDVTTGSPAEPNKPLATLNDAQMRYHELTKQEAPADKNLEELLEIISGLEASLKAEKTTPDATRRPLRTKADYQARYMELAGEEAPADKTVDELKEAIAHFEKQNPTA